MSKPPDLSGGAVAIGMDPKPISRRLLGFFVFLIVLCCCFCWPLSSLFSYALHSDLHSHIILIPFISAYLLYVHRDRLPETHHSSAGWALIPFTCGAIVLANAFISKSFEPAAVALVFICFVVAGAFLFLGKN